MNPLRWHRCPDCGRYDTDYDLDSDGYPPLLCSSCVTQEMERLLDPIKELEAEVSRLSAAHREVVNNLSRALRERYEAQKRIAALEAEAAQFAAEVSRLREQLNDADARYDELLERNGEACVRAEEAEDRAEKAERARADAAEQRIMELFDTIEVLEGRVRTRDKRIMALETEYAARLEQYYRACVRAEEAKDRAEKAERELSRPAVCKGSDDPLGCPNAPCEDCIPWWRARAEEAERELAEERMRKLERPVDPGPATPIGPGLYPPPLGCVCPLGAQRVCREPLCPRKGWEITSGSGA